MATQWQHGYVQVLLKQILKSLAHLVEGDIDVETLANKVVIRLTKAWPKTSVFVAVNRKIQHSENNNCKLK